MRRAYDGVIRIIQTFSAVLCLMMLTLVFVGVFYRYILDSALSWYDEFAGFILVWLTMYGSVVALARRKHIAFETLVERLSRRAQRAAEIFALLCILGFAVVLVVTGWQLIREMGSETAVSIPWVKMAWVYSVMPVSGALMAIVCLVQLAEAVSGASKPRTSSSDAERARAIAKAAGQLEESISPIEETR